MTIQKNPLVIGSTAKGGQTLSPISKIRRARRALPNCTSNDARRPMNIGSAAIHPPSTGTEDFAHVPLLGQLINAVRARARERERYLKEREVLATIARSKAAMRRDVSLGLFPAPIKTGIKSSAWRESEVMGWVEATTVLSRVANPGFDMATFIATLNTPINVAAKVFA
jgi:predicted DNA-binding transcriptional regulator AlpA